MKSAELLELLHEFHRDKLGLRQRHAAAARHVRDYEINNAYQYVIAREDAQVGWLYDAVTDMGGRPDEVPEPEIKTPGKGAEGQKSILAVDRDLARATVEKWRPRIEVLPNARHRTMLQVILGETLEHLRMFEQALAGRSDVLGRRDDGAGTDGDVLPTRWIE